MDKVRGKVRDKVRYKVRYKVRNSRIHVLMKEDPESIPGNILSYHRGLRGYHAIYFLMTEDPEIIPGNISHNMDYTIYFAGWDFGIRLLRRPDIHL